MLKNRFLKLFVTLFSLGTCLSSNAQTVHPLSFQAYTLGTTTTGSNFYANYVGVSLDVVAPASISGPYSNTMAANANGWSNINYATALPIVNAEVIVAAEDTTACSTLLNGTGSYPSLAGKVALVFRGGCYFSQKAYAAQQAGAIACIVVNNTTGLITMEGATDSNLVTIPTFMITEAGGLQILGQYRAGDTPYVTITTWGLGYANDLGFVPGGEALWHNYCIPSNQLTGGTSLPYMGNEGAFIANFGSNTETNVKLNGTLSFTSGSTTTVLHSDSVTLSTFTSIDSIWAMYMAPYNIPSISDTGHFTMTYTISSDSVDQFPGNNTYSYNFYATPSLYCKSRYDFVNYHPLASLYEQSGSDYYIWGDAYYIANGGSNLNAVQFSLEGGSTGPIDGSLVTPVYIFQWIDGYTDTPYAVTYPFDSLMENGELQLVGEAVKTYGGAADTSGGWWTVTIGDSLGNPLTLLANAGWYYVAAEVVGGGTTGYYLGCDGQLSAFPRVFGRNHFNNFYEYTAPVYGGGRMDGANPQVNNMDVALGAIPFMETSYITSVDSAVFHDQIGLIPSIALTSTMWPTSVNKVNAPAFALTVSPNPATEFVNATVSFPTAAKVVSYTIIDGLGHFVSKDTHYNVVGETFTKSTEDLSSGTYFMSVIADGKAMFKKFVVVK